MRLASFSAPTLCVWLPRVSGGCNGSRQKPRRVIGAAVPKQEDEKAQRTPLVVVGLICLGTIINYLARN